MGVCCIHTKANRSADLSMLWYVRITVSYNARLFAILRHRRGILRIFISTCFSYCFRFQQKQNRKIAWGDKVFDVGFGRRDQFNQYNTMR